METEVKTTTPKIRGCKKSSFHHWIYMGDKGQERYTCPVCGVKINTYGPPAVMGCKDGQTHQWVKA
jgi:hypothetical protein